jgi:hydroxymethylpyrimidine pyrophosphatase-like HAD family hydrolase
VDYDGTIAEDGVVSDRTIQSLEKVRESGRQVVLVTGRQLEDLLRVFPRVEIFDRVVAENGAVLYCPTTREQRVFAESAGAEFIRALREAGIYPLDEGRVIVATQRPNETKILEIIRDMGLELQVIFNHGAVMVLPSGVNKASGLKVALHEIGLSVHNSVGIGDAENDHAFLAITECSVAVANALDALKKRVDYVTRGEAGDGVVELIDHLLDSDLRALPPLSRHRIVFGLRADHSEVSISPYGNSVLIAGPSGSGKSTLASTFLEKLGGFGYQVCVVDPEGDYSELEGAVTLGDNQRPPTVPEVLKLLAEPWQNVTVNLLGIPLKDRPAFFESLLHGVQELRGRTGRPHWLMIDETHHVLPSAWKYPGPTVPDPSLSVMMITVEPDKLPQAALQLADLVIAVGENPDRTLDIFCDAVGYARSSNFGAELSTGEAIGWFCKTADPPFLFQGFPPTSERQRHQRKYAEGELPPELSFYFRGPEKKLNLRAQNLSVFVQIAEGVDDATWLFHLREGDVSRWFREVIKDPELAIEAQRFEHDATPDPHSRAHVLSEIRKRYIVA